MHLGFYFHVPFSRRGGRVFVPSNIGVALRGLADEAGSLTFYGHHDEHGTGTEDFALPATVRTIDLGPLRSFPARTFVPGRDLQHFRPREDGVDAMLVLGATPLLPHLVRRSDVPTVVMLWADYSTWRAQEHFPWWRNALIRLWTAIYAAQQRRATRRRLVFLQSPTLRSNVSRPARMEVAFLPSLTDAAARELAVRRQRVAGGRDHPLRLLYAGRIVREKGLFESVEAIARLRGSGVDAELRLAGWEEPGSGIVASLQAYADALNIGDRLTFLGYRSGDDLLDAYAAADIFVLPSYWEGFPRAIHEAMAVGLPVIATAVGGIPFFLRHDETAFLIEPRDSAVLAVAVQRIVEHPDLSAAVAREGQRWALAHTVEGACRQIVHTMDEWLAGAR